MQENNGSGWLNMSTDGWGVTLTDKQSTAPVTSEVCTYINGNPVVSMSMMFMESNATGIDLSSFNTSYIINMAGMFWNSRATSLNLSTFDTGNVVDMTYMFQASAVTSLDLSSFDMSKVTEKSDMFKGTSATVGYARTQADANILNSTSNKPSTLTFVVK